MRDLIVKLIHTGAFFVDLATFLIQALTPCHMPACGFGWWYRYLTIWGLCTQCLYFLIAAVYDFAPHNSLRIHRDRFFTICFPLANLIGIVFWTLIFPVVPGLRHGASLFEGILQHGFTLVIIWIELFLVTHNYGKPLLECIILLGYGLTYLAWNFYCHARDKVWAYPFQSGLTVWMGIVIYGGMVLATVGLYWLGRWISAKVKMSNHDFELLE